MPGVSLDDRGAWDDSALINSWEEAVAEYEKYHSIRRSGKRLEDVLSEEELRQLHEEHRDLIEMETRSSVADPNANADHEDAGGHAEQANGIQAESQSGCHAEEQAASGHQDAAGAAETGTLHDAPVAASIPQAVLGTVQDENLKNLMMSWYYAGYYTGLVAGQQQAASDSARAKEQK